LLSLHPAASGRVYAAYGAVYASMALLWLRLVDGVVPIGRDLLGVAVVLVGLGVLISGGPQRP
jgi:small multidrug resistance family-3 protein